MSRRFRLFSICLLVGLLPFLLLPAAEAQAPAGTTPPAPAGPRPYTEVITKGAVSTPGLFTVHRLKGKVFYEIPDRTLGRDMLWYTEVTKAPAGIGYGGAAIGSRSIRWERVGDRILLRLLSFDKLVDVEDPDDPPAIRRAVEDASLPPIVMAFDVEAEGKEGSAVIDVTKLLTSNIEEFSAERIFTQAGVSVRGADGRANVDASRSYVEEVKAFPGNIEARSVITFRVMPAGASDPVTQRPAAVSPGDIRSASVVVHYSMTLLPDTPMRARLFDPRVGYFADSYEDYSKGDKKVATRRYINRYRLEKRNPDAPYSEPVRPIVFYIGREVPEEWRPSIKKAVEDWQPAFEAAGFRNAIIARDAPSEQEDPAWDPEDTRYSVIRWGAVPIQNAIGPNVHDPRSGEILSADIVIYQDILKLAQQWYFSMCAAVDPRARKFPLPDELKGEILRYIVAHEVGHAIGLRHNHKASSAFSVEQLRDPAFTAKYGTVASITSYGRFNYVAQPGDNVVRLMPGIGPYDQFAVGWGYKPLPEADSPDDEKPILDRMAARQVEDPWLRFGGEDGASQVDPTVKVQNIGSDPVRATDLGLKNLARAADFLLPATTRLGEDFSDLKEAYYSLLDTRHAWLVSIVNVIGGVVENRTLGGRGGDQFARVPKEKQREALRFVLDKGFDTPEWLLRPGILNKFRCLGVSDPVTQKQKLLLEELLSGKRYKLLKDFEALDQSAAYTLAEFFVDVQNGLFREAGAEQPMVHVYRRELQRQYLAHLKAQLSATPQAAQRRGIFEADEPIRNVPLSATDTDFRAVSRSALGALSTKLAAATARTRDEMTAIHFRDCMWEINRILEPVR
ncbi:MAG: zinc-dependent metalloprotease [bacterium]|nr:zinc-dependent metalloprotease [bacterium]